MKKLPLLILILFSFVSAKTQNTQKDNSKHSYLVAKYYKYACELGDIEACKEIKTTELTKTKKEAK